MNMMEQLMYFRRVACTSIRFSLSHTFRKNPTWYGIYAGFWTSVVGTILGRFFERGLYFRGRNWPPTYGLTSVRIQSPQSYSTWPKPTCFYPCKMVNCFCKYNSVSNSHLSNWYNPKSPNGTDSPSGSLNNLSLTSLPAQWSTLFGSHFNHLLNQRNSWILWRFRLQSIQSSCECSVSCFDGLPQGSLSEPRLQKHALTLEDH